MCQCTSLGIPEVAQLQGHEEACPHRSISHGGHLKTTCWEHGVMALRRELYGRGGEELGNVSHY